MRPDYRNYSPSWVRSFSRRGHLMAFAAGAMDYIRKPVNPVELVARVTSALTLRAERNTRKAREQELLMRAQELEQALRDVKVLRRMIPICTNCKRVRTDAGD